jgi:hypothetical protein
MTTHIITAERFCGTCKHDDDTNCSVCAKCDYSVVSWGKIGKVVYIRPEHDFYEAKN